MNEPNTVIPVFSLSTDLFWNELNVVGFLSSASLDTLDPQHNHSGFAFGFDLKRRISFLLFYKTK